MKILVTGATGLLGRAVMQTLAADPEYSPLGIARSRRAAQVVNLDLLDFSTVEGFLRREMPPVIIHLAAERRPDAFRDNADRSRRLNVDATANLARIAASIDAWMLYLSTDYVFDGENPPYAPDDAPNPLNAYGKSKYEGELALWGETSSGAVLRVPLLYGPSSDPAESPVTELTGLLANGGIADDWQRRYPTYTPDVAAVLMRMVGALRRDAFFAGTFHWSGKEELTKFGMIGIIAEVLGSSLDGIIPRKVPGEGAVRPFDTRLDCEALEKLGVPAPTLFREGIAAVLPQLEGAR